MKSTQPDFVLARHEFDLLWGELRLGPKPYPLEVRGVPSDRGELVEEVQRELADRGLVHGDTIHSGLESLLRLLDGYERALDAVADIGYPVRVLAAAAGSAGVLAVLAGEELWLTGVDPSQLVPAIAGALPEALAGDAGFGVSYRVYGPSTESVPWLIESGTDED